MINIQLAFLRVGILQNGIKWSVNQNLQDKIRKIMDKLVWELPEICKVPLNSVAGGIIHASHQDGASFSGIIIPSLSTEHSS